tara:strand:- start:1195 stop:1764 length:570 start_codon:yes stop_codon:yes gene_type:complete
MTANKNLYQFIQTFKNAIPTNFCDEVVSSLDSNENWQHDNWGELKNTGEIVNPKGDSKVLYRGHYSDDHYLELRKWVRVAINQYFPELGIGANYLSPLRINKYETGDCMRYHKDYIRNIFDGERKGIPILSILGCLDDKHEGGEIVFNKEHKIKLNKGEILIFPSTFMYSHEIAPVRSGRRISFATWGY